MTACLLVSSSNTKSFQSSSVHLRRSVRALVHAFSDTTHNCTYEIMQCFFHEQEQNQEFKLFSVFGVILLCVAVRITYL